MGAERYWLSINGGNTWFEVTQEEFRRTERAMGFLPTAAFSTATGMIRGTTLDPQKLGGKIIGLSNKWMCPQCGSMGVDRAGTPGAVAPLCHSKGCDYVVPMVNISDTLYNKLSYKSWKAAEYDRKKPQVPQCVTCKKYVFWGTYDNDGIGIALRCIGCFLPQEGCTCE